MAGTRSSARLSGSSPQSKTPSNGTKRKAPDSSPSSTKTKKERKTSEKEQKTIEEAFDTGNQAEAKNTSDDVEMKDAGNVGQGGKSEESGDQNKFTGGKNDEARNPHDDKPSCWGWSDNESYDPYKQDTGGELKVGDSWKGKNKEGESKDDPEKALKDSRGGSGLNALGGDEPVVKDPPHDDVHADADNKPKDVSSKGADNKNKDTSSEGAVVETDERANIQPSNVLEKGVIYFFTRGRVGIDDPDNVADLQRTHFVLRPLPPGAKLTDGAIEDVGNNRLIALPKKVFPKSSRDKFMAFVEKGKTTLKDLKESFFQGSEYTTKTTGVRHTPPVTPVAEGVYAITKAGDREETHLAYMLTIPRDPGEMQEDIGIASKGAFILSLKNPTVKGPAYASLPESADFPKEFIEEFGGRGWMPAQPKHLDYPNAQILLIGENFDESHALDATAKDEKSDEKETPQEELEKLEGEDELRVEHLKGDDTVFNDLGISHKEYPSVPTTW